MWRDELLIAAKGVFDALAGFRREGRRGRRLVAFKSVGVATGRVSEEEQLAAKPVAQLTQPEVPPQCETLSKRERPVQGFRYEPCNFLAGYHCIPRSSLETHGIDFQTSSETAARPIQHHT